MTTRNPAAPERDAWAIAKQNGATTSTPAPPCSPILWKPCINARTAKGMGSVRKSKAAGRIPSTNCAALRPLRHRLNRSHSPIPQEAAARSETEFIACGSRSCLTDWRSPAAPQTTIPSHTHLPRRRRVQRLFRPSRRTSTGHNTPPAADLRFIRSMASS